MVNGHDEKATALFHKGYNCSQAVLCAFSEELGIDDQTALAVSSSFGGGMGRLRQVCGAVSGALMVLGLYYGGFTPGDQRGKAEHYARVQALAKAFEAQSGSIICKELLATHGQTAEVGGIPTLRNEEFYGKRRICADSIALAARLTEQYIHEHPKKGTDTQ